MTQSMTGFGKAESVINNKKITVEIKSLNSKFLDLNLKLPGLYKNKEILIRSLIAESILRGKVELSIHYDLIETEQSYYLNKNAIKKYYDSFQAIVDEVQIQNAKQIDYLSHIMRLPDVLKSDKKDLSEDEWEKVVSLINIAVEELTAFRSNEGAAMKKDLITQINSIQNLLKKCLSFENKRIPVITERLRKNLDTLPINKDELNQNRFEQELIYYLEKLDFSEEKVRLTKHCDHFIETLKETNSKGKKLGFISQEIGREINTLGSKANHLEIQKLVVQMKDHLEKIKEQILNIL